MRYDVELLRIAAAFGIVWFHSGYMVGKNIAYAGLIVFVIISSYFSVSSTHKYSLVQRATRLLLPCIVWSIFYGVFFRLVGREIFSMSHGVMSAILSTTALHLWYLPFIFVCTVLIDRVKCHYSQTTIAIFSAVAALFLLLSSPIWREFDVIPPYAQYIHAIPAVLIGVFLHSSKALPDGLKWALLFAVFSAIVILMYSNVPDIGLTYLVGVMGASILVFDKSLVPANAAIAELSQLTFGVYLVHVAVIFSVYFIGLAGFFVPAVSFLLSIVIIYVMRGVLRKLGLNHVVKYVA